MPMLATLALAALLAPQASTPPVKAVPMSAEVRVAKDADPATRAWAEELRAALEARKDEFRLVKPDEKAEFVVRIDSLGQAPDGTQVMTGALVMGPSTRAFAYGYTDVRAEAAKLARNLRKLADQMKASRP
jgi:hypothetical protein